MADLRVPLGEIKVGSRFRKDMGDLIGLSKSMESIGLLHPVVIDKSRNIIAGVRRVEAARLLNWDDIPCRVVTNLDDAEKLLRAEKDENDSREPFKPLEAVALGKALEALEKPKAKERQRAAGGDKKSAAAQSVTENFGKRSRDRTGEVTNRVGQSIGMSGRTYQKAKAVAEAAEKDPERFGAIAEEMNSTGKVTPAYETMRSIKSGVKVLSVNNGSPVFEPDTQRKLNVANKNYQRLGILFGQTQAIADGIEAINIDAALSVLKRHDADEWIEYAKRTAVALTDLSKRLKKEIEHARFAETTEEAED